jgi:hypothetical protein
MLSKAEMEAIWNGRSIGELKRISKGAKGKKPFRITAKLWHKTYLDEQPEISTVVWAKDSNKALDAGSWDLRIKVQSLYPEYENRPNCEYRVEAINA